jgi:hypothetical protein
MALLRQRWPWRDVAAESGWRWRYRGDVGHGMTLALSFAGNGVTNAMLVVALPTSMLT